ncbi:hypothetical protein R1flu_028695 [Riccia fluitans]|uniref:Uncharacterized protein n=1 Tax=Riccia fluitans TaxID=41844 RepID=A0ABD1XMI5_9MARC
MKEKVQFNELQLLRVVKGDRRQNWDDAVEKTVSKQIKALGVCNEAVCLGPYLAHLYSHFHEMDVEEKEESKKRKALIQTISDFDTKTEDEKESTEEVPHTVCEGKASGSKPLALKRTVDYDDWGIRLESLGWETSKLFEAFHVEVGNVIAEVMARIMKEIFTASPMVEVDIQLWKEMVKNMIKLLTVEQKKNKDVVE